MGVATDATFSLIVNDYRVIRQEIYLKGSHVDRLQIFHQTIVFHWHFSFAPGTMQILMSIYF